METPDSGHVAVCDGSPGHERKVVRHVHSVSSVPGCPCMDHSSIPDRALVSRKAKELSSDVVEWPVVSKKSLVVGLCAGVLAIAFESMSVGTAMPAAAADLGQRELYAWVFSLFVIGMMATTVIGGRIADAHGPVAPLYVGIAVFGVGLLVSGFAPAMAVLLLGRTLQGVGSGLVNIGWAVVLAHAFDAKERPTLMGLFSTCWVVPSFIGPPIAAWLTRTLSWHWVFFSVVPILVIAGVLCAKPLALLRREHSLDPDGEQPRPVPYWAALATGLGVAALQFAGQQFADGQAGTSWTIWVSLAVGAVLLVLGVPRLLPVRAPAGTAGPGRRSSILTVLGARFLIAGPFFGAQSFLPLMMVEQHGWSLLLAGGLLTVGAIGWTAASWVQSRSIPWLPRGRIILVGNITLTLALAAVGLGAALPSLWLGVIVAGWVLAGFSMGFAVTSTSLAVINLSEPLAQGRNNAALQVSDNLGSSVLVAVAGTIYAALHPSGDLALTYGTLLVAMVVAAVAGVAVSSRIGPLRDPA
ncbi:MAG TPA: MFS transporter [Propionibacteriaceae bacterium]|nr:MFS transporter [Propionibacteriaceae bacterium]